MSEPLPTVGPDASPHPLDVALGVTLTPYQVRGYHVGRLATQPGTGRRLASYLLDGLPADEAAQAAAGVLPAGFVAVGFAAVVELGWRIQEFREDGLDATRPHFPDPEAPAAEGGLPDRLRVPLRLWVYGYLADLRMYLAPPHREVWVERAGRCVYTYTV